METYGEVSCFWLQGQPIIWYWCGSHLGTMIREIPTCVMKQNHLFQHWCHKSLSSPSACFMHCCNISYTAALGHEGFHPLWQETHYPSGSRRSPAASWTKFLFIGILNAKLHNSLSSTFEWQSWELCTSCAYMLHMRRVTFLGFKHSVNKFFSIGLLRITVVVYMRTRCFPTSWKRLPPILW